MMKKCERVQLSEAWRRRFTVWPLTVADSLLIIQNPCELSTGVNVMLWAG